MKNTFIHTSQMVKMTAKFNSTCSYSGAEIKKGDTFYYWPKMRKAFTVQAFNDLEAQNASADFDERQYLIG